MSEINVKDVLESWVETVNPKDDFEKEASEIIISALEKQIPKKPIVHWTGNEEEVICPTCKDYICFPEDIDSVVEKYRKHCGVCGQAIDWSAEE